MIIDIRCSGGLAGFDNEPVAKLDTAALTAEQSRHIRQCIDTLAAGEPSFGTDLLRYDITVVDDQGGQRSLAVFDESDPRSPLNDLLDAVGAAP